MRKIDLNQKNAICFKKNKLLHFSRIHQAPTQHIQLRDVLIKLIKSAQFLEI
jgi:hypothetical protein